MSEGKKAWISVVVAAGCCLVSIFVGIPLLKRKVQRDLDAQEERRRWVQGSEVVWLRVPLRLATSLHCAEGGGKGLSAGCSTCV
jgi:hypothetical protein